MSDSDGNSEVLTLSFPGDHLRESNSFCFVETASGQNAKKALALIVRLWREGRRVIENACSGMNADESEEEESGYRKKRTNKGKSGEGSTGEGSDCDGMGGDCPEKEERDANKAATVRLIYMGIRTKGNPETVTKHTYWLVRKGGGRSLAMDARLDFIINQNKLREKKFQAQKDKNKLRPLQRGAARPQTPDTFVVNIMTDWVRGTGLWCMGYAHQEMLSLKTQNSIEGGEDGKTKIGVDHWTFPEIAKVGSVFDPTRQILRVYGDHEEMDSDVTGVRNYLGDSIAQCSPSEIRMKMADWNGKGMWSRGVSFQKFLNDASLHRPLIVEIHKTMGVASFFQHCDPSYHILRLMPTMTKIAAVPTFSHAEDEFADFAQLPDPSPSTTLSSKVTVDMMSANASESARYLAGEDVTAKESSSSTRTPLHVMRDWYKRSFVSTSTDHTAAQWQALTYLGDTAMSDPLIADSTHSLWRQVSVHGSGVSGNESDRFLDTCHPFDPSMSSFANMMQRFHLDLEVGVGIAVTHNLVATLKQSLLDVLFFKEGKLMHNVMELGDAQSGKTHTMTTMQKMAVPDTVEMVHHITTHAFTTNGPPIIHKVIACDEAPSAWFASTDGGSVRASGNGNNPSEDVMKGILTSGRANVRRPKVNAETGNLGDGCSERLVAAAFWVCSNRPADTFSKAMGTRFWQIDVNEVERDGRNISDKQVQEELDADRSLSRPDTDTDPDFRKRAISSFRNQQGVIFLCAVMQDFAGMARPCKMLVPIVVGRMRGIFAAYGFIITPRITSQISRLANVFCHEDAYYRNFRTVGGLFAEGDFEPHMLFDRERNFESDLIITEEMVLQAVWWVWPQFLPFPLIRTMQLIWQCLQAGEWEFTKLFLKPYDNERTDDGTSSDYIDPGGLCDLKDRIDFDNLHIPADSIDDLAERLVAHQRTSRAGAIHDGSTALSARAITAALRGLRETTWGQTRHSQLETVIVGTDGEDFMYNKKDGRKINFQDLETTDAKFRTLIREGKTNQALQYFPHECFSAANASRTIRTINTFLNKAYVQEHDDCVTIVGIRDACDRLKHDATADSQATWTLEVVRLGFVSVQEAAECLRSDGPVGVYLTDPGHTELLAMIVRLQSELRSLLYPSRQTSASFTDLTYKHKLIRLSTHVVYTLGDPGYLTNIRRKVMQEYAHTSTVSRHVLIGMSSFGQSDNDDKPYLLAYDKLVRNPQDDITFPNQNFLDGRTFNLMLPPDETLTNGTQAVPPSMRHDYQGVNGKYNLDRVAAAHHLETLGIERSEFRMFWADRSKEITFDRPLFETIRDEVPGGYRVWDECMSQRDKMTAIRQKISLEYKVLLDQDESLVARELATIDVADDASLHHRMGGWRRRLYALSWRVFSLDSLPRDPLDKCKLRDGVKRENAQINHRSAKAMRNRKKRKHSGGGTSEREHPFGPMLDGAVDEDEDIIEYIEDDGVCAQE